MQHVFDGAPYAKLDPGWSTNLRFNTILGGRIRFKLMGRLMQNSTLGCLHTSSKAIVNTILGGRIQFNLMGRLTQNS